MTISTMVPSRYMKVQWHGYVFGSCVWESHHRPAGGFPQQSSGIAEIWFLHFGPNRSFIKQSICQWIMMPWNSCDIIAMLSAVIHRFTGPREKNITSHHYDDVVMGAIASQITSLPIVYLTVHSDADQRKHQTPRHWSLCGEFTGDRWIPPTNGQ